ncbi:MAG: archaeosortase/exosortase family protein [Myxococcota bacterium]
MTPAPLTALGLLGCATSLGALGWWWHAAWGLSLPLAIGGIIARRSKTSLHNSLVLLVLLAIAYPFQRHVTIHFDHTLQYITAVCAAPLVNLSGLAVSVLDAGDPVIVGERLRVTVTSLCAGSQTLLALVTLGLISAAVFLKQGWAIWCLLCLRPCLVLWVTWYGLRSAPTPLNCSAAIHQPGISPTMSSAIRRFY